LDLWRDLDAALLRIGVKAGLIRSLALTLGETLEDLALRKLRITEDKGHPSGD
jgi:hypothetical protein